MISSPIAQKPPALINIHHSNPLNTTSISNPASSSPLPLRGQLPHPDTNCIPLPRLQPNALIVPAKPLQPRLIVRRRQVPRLSPAENNNSCWPSQLLVAGSPSLFLLGVEERAEFVFQAADSLVVLWRCACMACPAGSSGCGGEGGRARRPGRPQCCWNAGSHDLFSMIMRQNQCVPSATGSSLTSASHEMRSLHASWRSSLSVGVALKTT